MSRWTTRGAWMVFPVAGAVVLSSACGGSPPPELPPVVRPVKTMTVGGVDGDQMSFPGTVQAVDRAILSFRVPGPLVELPVDEGNRVRRGQKLASLDPTNYELAVAEARAAFNKADADHARYQRLYEREAVPLAEVELRRAQRDISKARLDQARVDLGYTKLVAPFSGFIGRKYVENFEDVQAKEPILTLQNVETVELVIDIPEQIMARVRGLEDEIDFLATFDTARGEEFPLRYKESTAEADVRTRTYQVTFSMEQPGTIQVLPGMTGTVMARAKEGGQAAAVAEIRIPSVAVFADDVGNSQVWVVDPADRTVHLRAVEIGQITGDKEVVVLAGLEVGETIATTGMYELIDGEEIRFLETEY